MSHLLRVLTLLTVTIGLIMTGGRVPAAEFSAPLPRSTQSGLLPPYFVTLSPGQARKVNYDEAALDFGADVVAAETLISITPLAQDNLPALDQGMTNVTKGPRQGYRFLPHMQFRNKIKIGVPYDKTLIPPGLTEQDVKTFYFDEQAGSWKELERVAVDTQAKVIISLTDHFTDMINATVTVPDHPQTLSYNPNSIKDIKAADPGAGINLIDAPQANSMGDARLAYPIEVPPGRNGMQPQLSVNYNSSGGEGWLGLGWDLALPAITIDTRWGVPRYDAANETETYSFNGEQLTPVAHRNSLQARAAEKIFHTRVEGQFQKIIRHGAHPASYWWEVVDKNGTRFFYGGSPETNGPAADSTLADPAGNIFKWALREVRDLNGNGITYTCVRVSDPGLSGGTVPGYQLYLKTINYTRSNGAPGAYTVTFIRDSELPNYTRRPDVVIDARGGFKMVTAALLKRVEVTVDGDLIRRYDFNYQEGAFKKTLLRSITQYGENGAAFHTHEFTYYDDLRTESGGYHGFDTTSTWNTGDDHVTAGLLGYGQASALSGSISESVGGHLYVGFNPLLASKHRSIGVKVGYNHSSNDGVLALIDINGDDLPDKIFKTGGGVAFRLNRSGPGGTTTFGPARSVPTLPAISKERSNTVSFGPEEYLVGNGLINHANTFSTGSLYLSDVNGDGLPDLVSDGQVLFNHLDTNGVPTFSPDSSSTPVPIGPGAVDSTDIISDYESVYQQSIDNFPLQDSLRRWVAPYDGQIQITGTVALLQDTSAARSEYSTADGVRVAIQHNGSEVWATSIAADDYSPKSPSGVEAISVRAGDRIYFRVQSRFDGAYDQVAWNPTITYRNVPATTDVNALDPYRYQASQDFVLAGRRDILVQMPLTGTVRLEGDLHKRGVTTDDVTLMVLKNGAPAFSQTLAWNQTGDIALGQEIAVAQNDTIQLRVRVDSPIDLRQIAWTPNLFYTATSDPNLRLRDDDGNYLIQLHPPYDIDMYPETDLSAPQQSWTATQTGTLTVVSQLATDAGDTSTNGAVTFTVKRQGALLAKHTLTISDGVVQNAQFDLDVSQGDELYFDYSTLDPALKDKLHAATVVAYGDPTLVPTLPVPSALHSAAITGLYAQPYRGWAYAGYNGNRDRAVQPIDESLLVFDKDTYDPATTKAYPFNPFPEAGAWRGPDDQGWVKGDQISSSRLGLDFIEVPRPSNFAGGRAVNRLSRTSQTAVGGGVSLLSGSISSGTSYGEVDYLDMNGDRFPDIVGNGHVQYTTMVGGLEDTNRAIPGLDRVRESDDSAKNIGVGGSPATFKANARGEVDTSGKGSPRDNNTGSQMVSLGLSGDLGEGSSDVKADLLDINGDGLPDRISRNGSQLMVAFNLGYRFADPEPWGQAAINDGSSKNFSIGASLGFNAGIYDYAGGLSLSKNDSQSGQTLLDINGDGLLDRVSPNGSSLRVAFNTGNGFAPETDWDGALTKGIATSGNIGLGGGAYFTFPIPLCVMACYIILNPGADYSRNMARQETALRDVDGDGYADQVASTDDGTMTVARNRTDRTNLLKSIKRPLGATIDLEYQRDGNTYDLPQSRWVLSRVTLLDGHPGDGVDSQVTTFRYANGFYSRLEREFYGYAQVTEEDRNAASGEALYRAVVREFFNDSYYTKGLLKKERTQDAAGRPFTEMEQTYLLRDVATGAEPADPQSTTATLFPQLVRTDQRFYEGSPTPGKSTYVTYQYDALGNVTRFFDAGDGGAQDDALATIDYATCANTYLVGTPTKIVVAGNGAEMRHREATVDCATGDVTQVRQFLNQDTAAVTDLAYFPNGNLQQVTGPPNQHGQRYRLDYAYDPVVQSHITAIDDSFGYSSSATYNLKYGTVATTTDLNANRTSYDYDAFGRVARITGPYEQGVITPTIRFEYHPEAAVPWALTQHFDSYRSPTDTIDTVVFVDGLKRVIQTKKDATVHVGPDSAPQDVMIVSGRVTFDFVGRSAEQYYPVTEPVGTPGMFNPNYDSVQPTRMEYDVLDRTTKATIPDNTATTTAYGFGADRAGVTQFQTTVTDANGIQKKTYQDVRQLITSVQEFHTPSVGAQQVIWTSYTYDALKQLVEVRDDHNNRTQIAYDNLGRRTIIDNPDTGKTEAVYDLASNVIAKITANLRAEGKQILYDYEFNRLTSITYPDFPGNNVRYTYGGPGASDNRAGRITLVSDESGTEERFYGRLGEITKEIKTVASDTQGGSNNSPEVYTTQYVYDTFGRLQSLTYPDGEVLTYRYDAGGLVRQAVGQKDGYIYDYVKRLEYDKFEQRAFVEAGNNVRTRYTYRPDNRRLENLQAGKGNGNLFQNLVYSYDNVGNVLSLANSVPVPPASQFGGPSVQTYNYDDLYRLTGASGSYQFMPDKTRRYSLSMTYDTIHNIRSKQQTDEIVQPSGVPIDQHKTSYDWTYSYDGLQPHAPTHIGDRTFSYDGDGNQAGWTDDRNGTRRNIVWDEENRIQSLFDNGHEETYKYDDAGERVIKRGPQGETVYVNQYFTIRNREIGTKHIYADTTRLVSKMMKQDKPGANPHGQTPMEKDEYFYHPDHLGSSNYVTDANGKVYEHLEYFPFGETWVEESTNTQRTPYLFTSKELDEETGLYYYGARYYDPRVSQFISADPLLSRNPEKGIDRSQFLNAYAYANNNPVMFIDPTGQEPQESSKATPSVITKSGRGTPDSIQASGVKRGGIVEPGRGAPDRLTKRIVVDTKEKTLSVIEKKTNKVLFTMSVVVGSKKNPTPHGVFHAGDWVRDYTTPKWGRESDEPWSETLLGGNAFGPYQLPLGEKPGYFIHGTMGPGWASLRWGQLLVSPESHGCVRLPNPDIIRLHDNIITNPRGMEIKIN